MLRLHDPLTGRVEEIVTARTSVIRVSCDEDLRAQLTGDVIRRLAGHHRIRAIGIWRPVPGAEDLGVRPAELQEGEADVHVGAAVGRWALARAEGLDPLAVRLALLRHHYRSDVTLTREDLAENDAVLARWRRRVAGWAESPGRPPAPAYVEEAVTALDADLDAPAVFPMITRLAADPSVPPGGKFETVIELDMILGLDLVRLVGHLPSYTNSP